MKKTIIFTVIIASIFLVLRYGGLFVFWLFTPGDGEPSKEELVLFERIKQESKITEVSRWPRYHISKPRDTATYMLILRKISCQNVNADSLKSQAYNIKEEIDLLNLHQNFYKYEVIYECKGGGDIRYSYKR